MSELSHDGLDCAEVWENEFMKKQCPVLGGGGGIRRRVAKAAVMQTYQDSYRIAAKNQIVMDRLMGDHKGVRKPSGDAKSSSSVENPKSMSIEADSLESWAPGESTVHTLKRISTAIRALTNTTKALKAENEQFRLNQETFIDPLEEINANERSRTTGLEVDDLLEELELERIEHERTQHSLERKVLETHKQAARLQYIEGITNAIYKENLELIRTIQEFQGRDGSDTKGCKAMMEALEVEVSRVKEALECNRNKMDVIDERATKTALELQQFKEKEWGILWKIVVWAAWCSARIVDLAAFAFFVYLAVSATGLRSSGVDKYRYAH